MEQPADGPLGPGESPHPPQHPFAECWLQLFTHSRIHSVTKLSDGNQGGANNLMAITQIFCIFSFEEGEG